jgi:hypothetical protein
MQKIPLRLKERWVSSYGDPAAIFLAIEINRG